MSRRPGRKLWFTYLGLGGVFLGILGMAEVDAGNSGEATLMFTLAGLFLLTLLAEWRHTGLGEWLGRLHAIPLLALLIYSIHQNPAEDVLAVSTLLVLYLVYRLPHYVSTEYSHQFKRVVVRSRHRALQAYLAGLLLIGSVFVPWRRVAVLPDTQDVPLETSHHPLYDPPKEGDLQDVDNIGRFYRTELVTDRYAASILLWAVTGGVLLWMIGRPPKEAWKGERRNDGEGDSP